MRQLFEKIKQFEKRKQYLLPAVFMIGGISAFSTIYLNSQRLDELENSNYIIKYNPNPGRPQVSVLYGYDDNKDGLVDRIQEAGLVPYKTGTPAFRLNETYLPKDRRWEWCLARLTLKGEKRE